jgi:hypothetical protein
MLSAESCALSLVALKVLHGMLVFFGFLERRKCSQVAPLARLGVLPA